MIYLNESITMKHLILHLFIFFSMSAFADGIENKRLKIDSLLLELETSENKLQTNQVKVKLGELYLNVDNAKALKYSQEAYEFSVETENIDIRKNAAYGLAYFYNGNGTYTKAIKYFIESDNLSRETDDTLGMILCQNGLGNLHLGDNHLEEALGHFKQANTLSELFKDTAHVAITYIGMGNATSKMGDNSRALIYYENAQFIYNKEKDPFVYAGILANKAESYAAIGDLNKALEHNFESLNIMIELDHGYGIAILNQNIGGVYLEQKKYAKALPYYNEAIKKNKIIGALDGLQSCYLSISEVHKKMNQKDLAYDYLELHINLKDSLFNIQNSEVIAEIQNKYDRKINDQKIVLLNKENDIKLSELERKEQEQIYLYGGLFLVVILLGFILNRYQISNKQKAIIQTSNEALNMTNKKLERQHDEILASITYAKRIQKAILPTNRVVKSHLKESFIFYKPKDIVAGDFYWLEQKEDKVLFAVGDCTGHGVPGAMVSVICNNALNRSVREHNLMDPGEILDKTRQIVIEEFEKSDEVVKDGMDIALCSIEEDELKYAGANNPLWIIRNNEIIETKGDKQPIGKFEKQLPYTTHFCNIQKGDSIYIFTDGFVDQFGGQKGKKFKVKALRELLISIHNLPMEEQKLKLRNTFSAWKDAFEQVDDVCVMGVRV